MYMFIWNKKQCKIKSLVFKDQIDLKKLFPPLYTYFL